MKTILILVALLFHMFVPTQALAKVYHCQRPNGTTYEDYKPCPGGKEIQHEPGEANAKEQLGTPMMKTARLYPDGRIPLLPTMDNHKWVKVTINDVIDVNFVIDTGASNILIPQEVAERLALLGSTKKREINWVSL